MRGLVPLVVVAVQAWLRLASWPRQMLRLVFRCVLHGVDGVVRIVFRGSFAGFSLTCLRVASRRASVRIVRGHSLNRLALSEARVPVIVGVRSLQHAGLTDWWALHNDSFKPNLLRKSA